MSRLPVAFALLAALSLTVPAGTAWGQDAAQAKRFAAAQKLYDEGAYTPALAEFRALAAETGSPNADLYAARCLRELGKLPEAYEAMTLALRNATAKAEADPARYTKTRNTAAADLAVLEPKVGKILIAVASPPPGLTVTLNGAPLPPEKLGVPVPLAIGEVVVLLHAPDRADVEKRVTLKGGETVTLPVAMEAVAPVEPPPATTTPPVEPPKDTPGPGVGSARIAGFAALGVGAAGMVTFAVAGEMANSRYDSISAACGGKRCTDPSFIPQINGGRQLDVTADVGLGVGLAGLVSGALLVALGGPKTTPPAVTAWVTAGGGGIGVRRAF